MGFEAAGRGGHFFYQGGVLLGHLVHLRHGLTDLRHAHTLLGAGRADFAHDVRHTPDAGHHFLHGVSGLVHQLAALLHAVHAGADEGFNFFGGLGTALRQRAHFASHHRKTTALLTGTGGFYRGIQSQNIGLKGNAVNHADDV